MEDIQSSSGLDPEMEFGELLDCHMECVYNSVKGDPELTKALNLLEQAMYMVKHRHGFIVARFHLRRVQALGRGQEELDLHLGFLMECVDVIHRNV